MAAGRRQVTREAWTRSVYRWFHGGRVSCISAVLVSAFPPVGDSRYGPIYLQCPEEAHLWRQNVDGWGGPEVEGVIASGYLRGFSSRVL